MKLKGSVKRARYQTYLRKMNRQYLDEVTERRTRRGKGRRAYELHSGASEELRTSPFVLDGPDRDYARHVRFFNDACGYMRTKKRTTLRTHHERAGHMDEMNEALWRVAEETRMLRVCEHLQHVEDVDRAHDAAFEAQYEDDIAFDEWYLQCDAEYGPCLYKRFAGTADTRTFALRKHEDNIAYATWCVSVLWSIGATALAAAQSRMKYTPVIARLAAHVAELEECFYAIHSRDLPNVRDDYTDAYDDLYDYDSWDCAHDVWDDALDMCMYDVPDVVCELCAHPLRYDMTCPDRVCELTRKHIDDTDTLW